MRTTERMLLICALALGACNPDGPREYDDYELVALLGDDARADEAMERLAGLGPEGVLLLEPLLLDGGADVTAQGRAIIALTQIGGPEADRALSLVQEDAGADELVRVWAIAGRIQLARDQETFLALASLIGEHPALERPIQLKLEQLEIGGVEALELLVKAPDLQAALQPALLAAAPKDLAVAMYTSDDDGVRRQAAAWLATKGQRGEAEAVGAAVNALLDCSDMGDAAAPPWAGGALYVPAIQWEREPARALIRNLIGWHLYAAKAEDRESINQIANNLWSVGLRSSGFYPSDAYSARQLADDWARIAGREDAVLLAQTAGYEGLAQLPGRW